MTRQWKMFKGGPTGPRRERLHVTLNRRGVILINYKMFEAMGQPEAAFLLYDERFQVIGIQPARQGEAYSFPIKHKEKTSHRTIYAWPFCKSFKVFPTNTVFFTNPEIDGDGVLVLDMNRAEEVVNRGPVVGE